MVKAKIDNFEKPFQNTKAYQSIEVRHNNTGESALY